MSIVVPCDRAIAVHAVQQPQVILPSSAWTGTD